MGLINRLLGREANEPGIPPEVRAVFDKVRHLLNDEDAQNDLYLPDVSAALVSGAAVDRIENAPGDFGRDVRNPIPVNGVLGELIYISHLVTSSGSRLVGHRIGTAANVDIYEVAAIDGTAWDVLFFDLYHPRRSRAAPTGLQIKPDTWILATNYRLDDFPQGIRVGVTRSTREFIGIPFVGPALHDESRFHELHRPSKHQTYLGLIQSLLDMKAHDEA